MQFLGEVLSIGTCVATVDHCVWLVEENGAKRSQTGLVQNNDN